MSVRSAALVFCFFVATSVLVHGVDVTKRSGGEHAHGGKVLAPVVEATEAGADDLPRDMRNPNPDDGSMLVDNSDPCDTYKGCGDCNQDSRCGWCAANSKCMVGGPDGPKLAKCAAWSKEFCEAESCSSYTSCMGCLADPYCGWCPGGEDERGTCMEGSGGGPSDGQCDGQWAHSPVRKGTNYKTASMLDATHKAYLREVCESPEKKISYAKPPPDNSKPQGVKKPEILSISPRFGPNFGYTVVTITGLWYGHVANNQTVYLGDRPCRTTTWRSESVLECVTPPATKMNERELVHVYVENDGLFSGEGADAHMATFEFRPMSIDSISALSGPTDGGTILTIKGENFGYKDHSPEVTIGGFPCLGTQWMSSTEIQCASPAGYGDDNEVTLEVLGVKSLNRKFKFVYDPPMILGISADSSPTVGNQTFTITGKNFGTALARPVVTVGGVPCMFQTRISHGEMTCSTPPNVGRNKRVVVAVGHRFTKEVGFVINYNPPIIASISPVHGPTPGGYLISIVGSDFGTGAYSPLMTFRPDYWLLDVLGKAASTYTPFSNPAWGAWANGTGAAGSAQANHNTSVYKLLPRKTAFETMNTSSSELDAFAILNATNKTLLQDATVKNEIKEMVRSGAEGSPVGVLQAVARAAVKMTAKDDGQSKNQDGKKDVTGMIAAAVAALQGVKNQQKNGVKVDSRVVADTVGQTVGGGGYGDGNGGVINGQRRRLLAMEQAVKESPRFHHLHRVLQHAERTAPTAHFARLAKALIFMQMDATASGGYGNENVNAGGYGAGEPNVGGYGATNEVDEDVNNITKNVTEELQPQTAGPTNFTNKSNTIPENIIPVEPNEEFSKVCPKGQGQDYTAGGLECIEVLVGGRPCVAVKMLSDTNLVCTAPDYVGANHSVVVIAGNQSSMLVSRTERLRRLMDLPDSVKKVKDVLFSFDPPVVTHMFPDVGPTSGNVTVTFKGFNFGTRDWKKDFGDATLEITVGGQPCLSSQWVSDSLVECLVPPGSGSKHKVFLTVAGQTYPPEGVEPLLFSYQGPELLNVVPAHGSTEGMYDLILTGRNFGTKYHLPNVFVDGAPCTSVKWVSNTVIKCLAPEGHGKDKSVVVWTGDQHSRLDNTMFSYDIPVVESITPAKCPTYGGCKVTIRGRNFGHEQGQHMQVKIGKYLCKTLGRGDQPLWLNPRALECFVEAGVGGKLNVQVTVSGLVSIPNDYFSYELPTVNSILPRHGSCEGGNIVNITGTNFGTFDSSPTVYVKGKKCLWTQWVSDNKLVCKTPSGYGADVKTTVKVSNQYSADTLLRSEAHFEYDPPEIHSVSSHHGPAIGGASLYLTGVNFAPDSQVVFNDMEAVGGKYVPCKSTKWISYEELLCSTPGGISVNHTIHIVSGGKRFFQTKIPGAKFIQECGEPEVPKDGSMDGENRKEGGRIVYTCKTGYTLVGDAVRECKRGKWTGFLPVCNPPPTKKPTIVYFEKDRSGEQNESKYDVAPEKEPGYDELNLAQKIAKAGIEKQESDKQVLAKQSRHEEEVKAAEKDAEAANKRVERAKQAMEMAQKENEKIQDKLQNFTESARVKMEEDFKKKSEEAKKNQERLRAQKKQSKTENEPINSAQPANLGEPEMGAVEASVEEKRALSMSEIEKSARRLADDYVVIDESKKLSERASTEKKTAEKLVANLRAKGGSSSSIYEAENARRKAEFDQSEAELKMKQADADAKEIQKKVKSDLPLVKKQGSDMFLRGELVPILFAPSGQLKPNRYEIFNVRKFARGGDSSEGSLLFSEAEGACKVFDSKVAFPSMMGAARIAGYHRCSPAWVANGDAYTVTRTESKISKENCPVKSRGIATYKVAKADVYCTRVISTTSEVAFIEETSDELVAALQSVDVKTGKLFRNYYDENSNEGQALDQSVYYRLTGKMMQEPKYHYDAPEVFKVTEGPVRTKGGDRISLHGVNFGPMDALNGKRKILVEAKVLDGSDGKGWVQCRVTKYVSDTLVYCFTPSGFSAAPGYFNSVRVTIGKQTSKVTDKTYYDYQKPIILKTDSLSADPKGKKFTFIFGFNYGTVARGFSTKESFVSINGEKCLETKYYGDDKLGCRYPPGSGANSEVTVSGVGGLTSIPTRGAFEYAKPTVLDVIPNHLPTVGGEITIKGYYFGECLATTKRCVLPKTFINGVPCVKESRVSNEEIKCTVPPGIGAKLRVKVELDGQVSNPNTKFSYDRPTIERLSMLHGPASGGYDVDIYGTNFGSDSVVEKQGKVTWKPPSVLLGGVRCEKTTRKSNTGLRCRVSKKPAMGKRQRVLVVVGDQETQIYSNASKLWTIDPPTVVSVSPQVIPMKSSSRSVIISGLNFGTSSSSGAKRNVIEAGVGKIKCTRVTRLSDTKMRCQIPSLKQISSQSRNNNDEWRRVWVRVGMEGHEQMSYDPNTNVVEKFYDMKYLKYAGVTMKGEAIASVTGPIEECESACTKRQGCVGFERRGNTCDLREKASLKTCGSSENRDVDVYIHESHASETLGYCHTDKDARFGPQVKTLSKSVGGINGNEWVTFTGENFGNKGSQLSLGPEKQGPVAYIGPSESDKCLKTVWISNRKLKCLTPPNDVASGIVHLDDSFDGEKDSPRAGMWENGPEMTASLGDDLLGSVYGRALQFNNDGPRVATTRPFDLRYGAYVSFMMKFGDNWGTDYAVALQYAKQEDSWNTIAVYPGYKYGHSFSAGWRQVVAKIPPATEATAIRIVMLKGSESKWSWTTQCGGKSKNTFSVDNVLVRTVPGGGIVRVQLDHGNNVMWSENTEAPVFKYESDGQADGSYRNLHHIVGSKGALGWPLQGQRWTECISKFKEVPKLKSIAECRNACDSSSENCQALSWHDYKKICRISINGKCETKSVSAGVYNVDGNGHSHTYYAKSISNPEGALSSSPESPGWVADTTVKQVQMEIFMNKPLIIQSVRFQPLDEQTGCSKPASVQIEATNNGKVARKYVLELESSNQPTAYRFPSTVTESVKISVLKYKKGGVKQCSGFRLVQFRGELLQKLSVAGQGYVRCSDKNSFDSRSRCEEAFNEDGDGFWSTRGQGGGSSTKVFFTEKFKLRSINFDQLDAHRMRDVLLRFTDGTKKVVSLENSPESQSIDLSQQVTSSLDMRVLSTWDNGPYPGQLIDTFKSQNNKLWLYPNKNEKLSYGFSSGKVQKIWFSGNAENLEPVRSLKTFPVKGGTNIAARLYGTANQCSDHFIAISPRRGMKWFFGNSKDVIKFAFNCNTKYIYGANVTENAKKACPLKKLATGLTIRIQVREDSVEFYDNECGTLKSKIAVPWDQFYLYFGASQDRIEYKSSFAWIGAKSYGTGAKSIEIFGSQVQNPDRAGAPLPKEGVFGPSGAIQPKPLPEKKVEEKDVLDEENPKPRLECVIVPNNPAYHYRGTPLKRKKLCCPPGFKKYGDGSGCRDGKGKYCYTYGNDLNKKNPHPCPSVLALAK